MLFGPGGAVDGKAVIGIRPEHIITGELVAGAPVKLEVPVELVEPMGSDTLVYGTLNDQALRIRMDGQARVVLGDSLPIGIDPSRASLFDKASELRL